MLKCILNIISKLSSFSPFTAGLLVVQFWEHKMISGHARFDSDSTRLTLVNHAKKPQNDELSLSTLFSVFFSDRRWWDFSIEWRLEKRERRKSWNKIYFYREKVFNWSYWSSLGSSDLTQRMIALLVFLFNSPSLDCTRDRFYTLRIFFSFFSFFHSLALFVRGLKTRRWWWDRC